jgi:hypothetical protein
MKVAAAIAENPQNPMEVICNIANNIGHIGAFIVKHATFYKNTGVADKEDVIIITPADEINHGSIAIKTLTDLQKPEERTIAISAKQGPARGFAQTLLKRCQADPVLQKEKIILLNNKAGRCCR